MFYIFIIAVSSLCVSLFPSLVTASAAFFSFSFLIYCCLGYKRLALSIFFGFLVGYLLGERQISQQLPHHLEGMPLELTGIVTGIPIITDNKIQFDFTIDHSSPLYFSGPVRLSVYQHNRAVTNTFHHIAPGQRWSFTAKLRRPRGLVNPHGFDYQVYLLRHNIMATGYVMQKKPVQLLAANTSSATISRWRWQLLQLLKHNFNESQYFPYVAGLLVGDTQWITDQQWEQLRTTGTIHLMAISGLHIGLISIVGFLFGRLLQKILATVFPSFVINAHNNYLALAFASLFAAMYSLLAGFTLPTQRALVMVLCFYMASLLKKPLSPWYGFSIALWFIALVDSFALYAQGFWLSFGAVAILLYGFYGYTNNTSKTLLSYISSTIKAQYLLFFGLASISLFAFQSLSFIAPFANFVALPLVSLLVIPSLFLTLIVILLSLLFPYSVIYAMLYLMVDIADGLLTVFHNTVLFFYQLSQIQDSLFFPANPFIYFFLCCLGVLLLLSPKGLRRYVPALSLLLLPFSEKTHDFSMRLTVFDVGQGTAVAIETENYHLMYDVGKRYSHRFDVGEHIVSPYFQALGKDEVDVLVVSHGDSDHAGGVKGLLKKTAAKKVLAGQPDAPLLPSHLVAEQCKEGQYWYWDNAKFTILWPTQEFLDKQPMHKKSNNYSCVLLIDVEGQSILLAGDIESLVEYQLLASNSLLQNIDILLVPHHGSKTSSSEEWVSQLSPTWAIVSAGYLNPFKHPHSRVIKRYQNIETVIFNTANDGAIQATFRQGQWQWKRWRYDQRRYWYD